MPAASSRVQSELKINAASVELRVTNSDVLQKTCNERSFGRRGNEAAFLAKENQIGQRYAPHVAWKMKNPNATRHTHFNTAHGMKCKVRSLQSFPSPARSRKAGPACSWPKHGSRTNIRGGVNGRRSLKRDLPTSGAAAAGLGNKTRKAVMTGSGGGMERDICVI